VWNMSSGTVSGAKGVSISARGLSDTQRVQFMSVHNGDRDRSEGKQILTI
jgi:hypothetical protein